MAHIHAKDIDVVAYVVILMENEDFGSRPLMAAIFSPMVEDCMRESVLRMAGPFNNLYVFTRKLPAKNVPYKEAMEFYDETVLGAISRYQTSSKQTCPEVPKLPLVPLSGPAFIKQAALRQLMSADTVAHCKQNKLGAGKVTPFLSTSSGDLAANTGSLAQSSPSPAPQPPTPQPPSCDPIALAMEESGLQVIPTSCPPAAVEVSIGHVDEQQQGEDGTGVLPDLDRMGEDVHRLLSNSDQSVQDDPAVKALLASIKRYERSDKEKDQKIVALTKLTLRMERQLLEYSDVASAEIAKGLIPKVKGVVSDVQRESMQQIKKEFEAVSSLLTKNTEAVPGSEGDAVKFSLARLSGNVTELRLVADNIMEAALCIDKKLSASGIFVQDDPLKQINIPEVLFQINSRVNDPSHQLQPTSYMAPVHLPPPAPIKATPQDLAQVPPRAPAQVPPPGFAQLPPPALVQVPLSSLAQVPPPGHLPSSAFTQAPPPAPVHLPPPSLARQPFHPLPESPLVNPGSQKLVRTIGLKRAVAATPEHSLSSVFASPASSTTPRAPKKVRFAPASSKGQVASDSSRGTARAARSLSSQFNSYQGDTPASNPALWNSMLRAQDTYEDFRPLSMDQISEKYEKYKK